MSAKLVVERYETDVNFKYLNVTIDAENEETRFSDWLEVEVMTHNSRKATDKSSHLVVKIVSGPENEHLNLDSCAKQVNETEINNVDTTSVFGPQYLRSHETDQIDNQNFLNKQQSIKQTFKNPNALPNIYVNKHLYDHNNTGASFESAICPLEYSLERVKENNARIMENIHMLNRALNYTKKKESHDVSCSKPIRSYTCSTCGKCFVYETGLRRHYSTRHAILDIQPRWQVVWTCIECFQVWPRQDVAMQHATRCCQANNLDCVREIKTSSLLQCEFCEKVFTSIPRLLRHAKTHTTASNYACNACEMAFSCYKTAEMHWLSCPWLRTCYNFHLGKLLLCNACDRKFRNYEQLYNHRYKAEHFMTKTHQNHINALGILVYQCELCGLWFPSVDLLLNHRNQYHPRYDNNLATGDVNYTENHAYSVTNENDIQEFEALKDQQY
ncbi:zinc finger protein 708-like [Cydia strobilella]|uniref:zinc finger protein 708-like n=1 Tax=Cydia strobilella TaxID=1100964 RepID=UPI003004F3A1